MNGITQILLRQLLGKDRGNKVIAFLDLIDGIDFDAVKQLLIAVRTKDLAGVLAALGKLGIKP